MDLLLHPQIIRELEALNDTGAYIVYGPDGVGKTTAVLQLLSAYQPQVIVPEKSTIKISSIQDMTAHFHLKSWQDERRVVVIDQADTMTLPAQNALLKTLEELPEATQIVLITSEIGRLLPTVRSRCRSIYFQAPAKEQVSAWVQERIDGSDESDTIALLARGLPARVEALLGDEELLQVLKLRLEQIEDLFDDDLYLAMQSSRSLQAELPDALDDITAYVRHKVRQFPSSRWIGYLQVVKYAQTLLTANASKRHVLDVIALHQRPEW